MHAAVAALQPQAATMPHFFPAVPSTGAWDFLDSPRGASAGCRHFERHVPQLSCCLNSTVVYVFSLLPIAQASAACVFHRLPGTHITLCSRPDPPLPPEALKADIAIT